MRNVQEQAAVEQFANDLRQETQRLQEELLRIGAIRDGAEAELEDLHSASDMYISIYIQICIYITIYIAAQGIWRSCLHLACCIPGRDLVFEMGGLFIHRIQYNVRNFFCIGLRRQAIEYVMQQICFLCFYFFYCFAFLGSRDVDYFRLKTIQIEIVNVLGGP